VLRVRILAPLALLAAIAAVVVFFLAGGKADEPDAIARYVAAWSRGDDRAAAALTDRPAAAKQALQASRAGLDGASVRARVRSRDEDGAHVDVAWNVPRFGRFAYTIRLTTKDGKIHWRERAVHPALGRRTRLGTATEAPKRAPILDRDGRPLVTDRAVVDIAVKAGEARSDTADRLAAAIDDVDAGPLARRIREAPKGRFLPVITLRAAAFRKVEETVTAIPGVTLNRTTAPLAPTSEFARPLLGTVGPATAEQIAESRGRLATGDVAGQSGLERLYDERLAGTSTRRVIVRERADGAPVRTLDKRGGGRGKALQTRLDLPTQTAAEAALEGVKKGALVAVQP
jgi:cell division protein FtsI/penicillin-binding protein 2